MEETTYSAYCHLFVCAFTMCRDRLVSDYKLDLKRSLLIPIHFRKNSSSRTSNTCSTYPIPFSHHASSTGHFFDTCRYRSNLCPNAMHHRSITFSSELCPTLPGSMPFPVMPTRTPIMKPKICPPLHVYLPVYATCRGDTDRTLSPVVFVVDEEFLIEKRSVVFSKCPLVNS